MDISKHPYNACDYRCERCLETGSCAVFRKLQSAGALDLWSERDEPSGEDAMDDLMESIEESLTEAGRRIKELALDEGLDPDELADHLPFDADGSRKDPLFIRCHDFTMRTHEFIRWAGAFVPDDCREYFKDISWHHTIVSAKVYRALGSPEDDEVLMQDSRNSAAVAVKSLTICMMAFEYLEPRCPTLALKCRELHTEAAEIKKEVRRRFRPSPA